jgi:hypothetical protein
MKMFFRNKCNHTKYKLEADFTDPVWCANCGWNFDIEDLDISSELKNELTHWIMKYIKIKNPHDTQIEKDLLLHFNNWGEKLQIKLELELGKPVLFVQIS